MKLRLCAVLGASVLFASVVSAQIVPDTAFVSRLPIPDPAYPFGEGPAVVIDGGHRNAHTAEGGYLAFAELLRRDGYVVSGTEARITAEGLRGVDVLVVSNALWEGDENWRAGIRSAGGQAFADDEVEALRDWVSGGGSLLLIADHFPFPGAIASLATALGLHWVDGLATDTVAPGTGSIVFRKGDGSLADHATTAGIDSVATWTGSAFELRRPGSALLTFGAHVVGRADAGGSRPGLEGYLQAGLFDFGAGRVAAFGEASMFTARIMTLRTGVRRLWGFNDPMGGQNPQFIRNVMRWLAEG